MKLASALALPLLALTAVSWFELAQTSSEVDDVRHQTDLARLSIGPSGLITALQDERNVASVSTLGQLEMVQLRVEDHGEARELVDAAAEAFREEVEAAPPEVGEAYADALGRLSELGQVRADVDAYNGPRNFTDIESVTAANGFFESYRRVIDPFFDATTRVSLSVDGDAELREGTELADHAARLIESLTLLVNVSIEHGMMSEGGIDLPSEIAEISMLRAEVEHHAAQLFATDGVYASMVEDLYPRELFDGVLAATGEAISGPGGTLDIPAVTAVTNIPPEEGLQAFQGALHEAINARADDLESAAEARRWLYVVLAVLALAVTAILTWFVSRSITRPLRSLTRQAKDMAERGLPDAVLDVLETPLGEDVAVPQVRPIRVTTRDEVADVATALNTVQESALDLAVEQAVLRRNIADSFVNLGRRNQNLLSRQLDFITELESNETDPDTLASLFRLDHLATRMRRNAESLLVLAGIEPPRSWAAPVAVVDVIRAAFGEVETYERAMVRDVQPAQVIGAVAADLAHLLAELVENALTFSPPDKSVEVRGRRREDGTYTIAVVDQGFGMPPSEIEQANKRLAGGESFTVAPSKYLGHYVAGNLAARHGIRIQLASTPGNGVTATVDLPERLVAPSTSFDGSPLPSRPGPVPVGAPGAAGPGMNGSAGSPLFGGAAAGGAAMGGAAMGGAAMGGPVVGGPTAGGAALGGPAPSGPAPGGPPVDGFAATADAGTWGPSGQAHRDYRVPTQGDPGPGPYPDDGHGHYPGAQAPAAFAQPGPPPGGPGSGPTGGPGAGFGGPVEGPGGGFGGAGSGSDAGFDGGREGYGAGFGGGPGGDPGRHAEGPADVFGGAVAGGGPEGPGPFDRGVPPPTSFPDDRPFSQGRGREAGGPLDIPVGGPGDAPLGAPEVSRTDHYGSHPDGPFVIDRGTGPVPVVGGGDGDGPQAGSLWSHLADVLPGPVAPGPRDQPDAGTPRPGDLPRRGDLPPRGDVPGLTAPGGPAPGRPVGGLGDGPVGGGPGSEPGFGGGGTRLGAGPPGGPGAGPPGGLRGGPSGAPGGGVGESPTGGTTPSGLARRVSGAQLPANQLRPIRRSDATPARGASPATGGPPGASPVGGGPDGARAPAGGQHVGGGGAGGFGPGGPGAAGDGGPAAFPGLGGAAVGGGQGFGSRGPGGQGFGGQGFGGQVPGGQGFGPAPGAGPSEQEAEEVAGDVYGFLSQFSAGVQRGLDEARDPEKDEG